HRDNSIKTGLFSNATRDTTRDIQPRPVPSAAAMNSARSGSAACGAAFEPPGVEYVPDAAGLEHFIVVKEPSRPVPGALRQAPGPVGQNSSPLSRRSCFCSADGTDTAKQSTPTKRMQMNSEYFFLANSGDKPSLAR